MNARVGPARRGARWAWRAALVGALLAALAVGAALALAGTQAGTRWLLARAAGAGLEVGRATGTLLGGLRLSGVRWQSASATVTLDTLVWQPRPGALARGRVDLGSVQANGVAVALRSGPDDEAEPAAWPRLRVPWPVHVRALTLRDVSIQRDGAPLLRDGELRARATLRASRLDLAVDTLRADALRVRGRVAVGLDARGALRGTLDWSYAAADRRWAGHADLDGAIAASVTVDHRLSAPAPATLRARIATPLEPGRWSAELALPDTTLGGFGAPPAWRGQATLHARGRGAGGSVDGDFALAGTPAGTLSGQLRVRGAGSAWTLESLVVNGPDDARVEVSGNVDFAATPNGRLLARWQALRWPLDGPAGVHARAGELTLEGRADAWRFALDTAIEGRHGGPGRLRAQGGGSTQAARVDSLEARLLDGTLRGTARVAFAGAPAWEYDLTARGLNPGRVHPDWPGAVSATVRGSGQVRDDAGIAQRATLAALGGQLRGHALSGGGALGQDGAVIHARDLRLRLGSAHLTLDGALPDPLRLRAGVPELAGLVPDASGAVEADVTVSGTPPALGVRGTVNATALAYTDWRLGTLRAALDLAPGAADRLVLDLRAQDLAGPLAIETLRVQAGPHASAHTLRADLQAPDWQASVEAHGGLGADQTWRGSLNEARVHTPDARTWTLDDPAALNIGASAQSLGQACLASAGARVCASGDHAAGAYAAQARLDDLPLAALAWVFPPDLQAEGLMAGTASLRGEPGAPPQGDLALRLGAGAWHWQGAGQEPLTFPHGGMQLDARLEAAATALTARIAPVGGGPALLDARLRGPALAALQAPDAPLTGQVTVRNLSVVPLRVLSADLADLAGVIDADVDVAGRWAAPRVSGRADLHDARVALPRLGTQLREVRLGLRAQGDGVLRIAGQARSGSGTLGVDGHLVLDAARGWPLELDISGEDFLASDTRAARVLVSPALSVRAAARRVTVRGDLGVPQALLRPAGAAQAPATSPDVVVIGRTDAPEPSPWTVDSELTVRLGDQVRLAYAGSAASLPTGVRVPGYALDARLGGRLTVRDRPGELTRASGTIEIEEGEFSAYGQRLDITAGRLRLADQPLDNPGVSLDAQRKVGDVTAGVRVRGRLQSPTLTVFSDPAMAQEEALSYLLLGRPLRGASTEEGSMLARAAGALGVSGGDRLAKRIGARLGLDELGVASADAGSGVQGPALQAGKYLSPRLYVGYGLGLFDQVGAFKVRFDLTERWVLEASSGLSQAVDLLYTRER